MDNLDLSLKIKVWDQKNNYFEIINKKEIKIEEIKRRCINEFKYPEEDINKIFLFYIDNDNDKNLITHYNELIYNAIETDSSNYFIELHAVINKKINNLGLDIEKKDNYYKMNNIINDNINDRIEPNKANIVKELNNKINKLEMAINYYKERIKNINTYYENIINSLIKNKTHIIMYNDNKIEKPNKIIDSKSKETIIKSEEIKKNMIENRDNLKEMEESNDHLFNFFNTNQKEKKNPKLKKNGKYKLEKLEFINNICDNCKNDILDKIYKCVLCDNYYLCDTCHKNKNKFHEHNDYFDIKYPPEVINQKKDNIKKNNSYDAVINQFNEFLNKIFFDKNGNLSFKEIHNSDLKNIEKIFKKMESINESPVTYFAKYQAFFINKQLKNINPEIRENIKKNIGILYSEISKKIN